MFALEQNESPADNAASLENLLSSLSMFQVSHPYDTIYCFISLAKNGEDIPIRYDQSLLQVLAEAVWRAIDGSKSVDIICRPWAPTAREIQMHNERFKANERVILPSWIRDTSFSEFAPRTQKVGVQYDRINAASFVGPPGKPIYNAANSSKFTTMSDQFTVNQITDYKMQCILKLRGLLVDVISSDGGNLRGPASRGIIPASWAKLARWEPKIPNGKGVPTAFWRTLCGSRSLDGSEPPNWYGKACEHAWELSASGNLDTEWMINHCGSSMTVEFLKKVRSTVWDRQMFKTKNVGMLGLGPSNSQDEMTVRDVDEVWVVKGCSVPVILRRIPSLGGADRHSFVGESYVHGLMGGGWREIVGTARENEWMNLQVV